MKLVKKVFWILPILIFIIWMSSCTTPQEPGGTTDSCEHTYNTDWEYNEKEHFHRATCEHKNLTKDNEPHQFNEWKALENGKEEQRSCTICTYAETRPKEIPSHQHTYEDWKVKKDPTEDEEGVIQRVCSQNASHIEEQKLPKLNGQSYAYRVETPSTCSSKGEASYTYDLGDQTLKFIVELGLASHSYGEWKMMLEPTKNTTGLLERVCSVNEQHKESFELPALNETDYTYSVEPADCLLDGKEVYRYQKDQQNFKIELPIPSTGHPYELRKDAYQHWLESNCEHHLKKEIQDHIYVNGICTACNHEQKEDDAVLYELNLTEDGYIASINPAYEGNSITILATYLDLPVVELKKSSFDGNSIVSITLPSSLQKIDEDVFAGFEQLQCVFYDGTIRDWCGNVFSSKTSNPMHLAKNFYQRGESYWEETTKIVIPIEIKNIGKYQFYGFSQIDEITLPTQLEQIAEEAFAECSKITEFFIPDTVFYLGKDILNGTNLKKFSVPFLSGKSTYNDSYIGYYFGVHTRGFTSGWNHQDKLSSLEELTLTKVTSLGEFALANLLNLKKLSLPNSLKELEKDRIFTGCPNLEYNEYLNGYYLGNEEHPYLLLVKMIDPEATSFEFADHTQLIMNRVFQGAKIAEIELPSTVVEIGENVFAESSLTSIWIPSSISRIKANAFSDCKDLEEVILPEDLTTIDSTAFSGTEIKKASLNLAARYILNDNSIEDLTISSGEGSMGLASYPALKRVQLTNGISDLGKNVLESCPSLEYTIENSIAYLGNEESPYLWCMYATDKMIEDINLPYDTRYIYENAFKDCTQLIGIRIPDRVLKIEENAFYNCKKLGFVYFGNPLAFLQTIEKQAFALCNSLTSINFPKSLTYLGEAVLGGCIRLERLTLPFVGSTPNPTSASASTLFTWIFGNISNQEGEYSMASIRQEYGSSSYSYSFNRIPAKIQEVNILGGKILYGAFSGFSGTIPNVNIDTFTLTKDVDVRSNLTGGLRPKYLTTPFECLSRFDMTDVLELTLTTPGETFSLNGSKYYSIQKLSFAGIKTITHSNYYVSTLTNVALPNDLEEIGNNVFRTSTGLESLILPKSIKKIGSNAFEATTALYYLGTEVEWNQVTKENITSPVYFYSETEIANGWHYVDNIPALW